MPFPAVRARLWLAFHETRLGLNQNLFGVEPDRTEVEARWRLRRERGIESSLKGLTDFYRGTSEEMRALFRTAGMDPDHALVRYGRGDQAFAISPQVFEPDDRGRSYRFRPRTRSVWLRQITIRKGPFMMFQVLDTPEHRAAATRAGAIVDLGSIQNTNSWGLRGAEPDPAAEVRGIVLGDSFMQAMFNGDSDTPPVYLERELRDAWKLSVSVINTGHIGYSPEQYYYSLVEYGERFRPHFIVVSLCPNDFGDGAAVMSGMADWTDEAAYWLDKIQIWSRSHLAACLIVPFRCMVKSRRSARRGPIRVRLNICCMFTRRSTASRSTSSSTRACGWLARPCGTGRKIARPGSIIARSGDDHLSPLGAALWARIVAQRLIRVFDVFDPESTRPAGTSEAPLNAQDCPSPRR